MGIAQFAKANALKSKKRSYTVHELSPPFADFAPFCFLPPDAFLPTLRNTAPDTSTSSDTDNDSDASSTCLSDNFLDVCSHNQSDEDLAMSIKYREVPFAPPSQTLDANAFMHEELMELLIHYDTVLLSSHERI